MGRPAGNNVQLIEYPLFDAWFAGRGISAIQNPAKLFTKNSGTDRLTNMQLQGQIPSGGVFFVSSMRCWTWFKSFATTEDTVAYGNIVAEPNFTSSAARMASLHDYIGYNAQVTLKINDVAQIILPWFQFPAGGGTYGQSTTAGVVFASNGVPGRESICRLVKPVQVSSLQGFWAAVQLFTLPKNEKEGGGFTGNAQGGAITNDLDVKLQIDQADGGKAAGIVLGGHLSRDIGG